MTVFKLWVADSEIPAASMPGNHLDDVILHLMPVGHQEALLLVCSRPGSTHALRVMDASYCINT